MSLEQQTNQNQSGGKSTMFKFALAFLFLIFAASLAFGVLSLAGALPGGFLSSALSTIGSGLSTVLPAIISNNGAYLATAVGGVGVLGTGVAVASGGEKKQQDVVIVQNPAPVRQDELVQLQQAPAPQKASVVVKRVPDQQQGPAAPQKATHVDPTKDHSTPAPAPAPNDASNLGAKGAQAARSK